MAFAVFNSLFFLFPCTNSFSVHSVVVLYLYCVAKQVLLSCKCIGVAEGETDSLVAERYLSLKPNRSSQGCLFSDVKINSTLYYNTRVYNSDWPNQFVTEFTACWPQGYARIAPGRIPGARVGPWKTSKHRKI